MAGALAAPDPRLQALGIAVTLEEGVDKYADQLIDSVARPGGSWAAAALARTGALEGLDDPCLDTLRAWADGPDAPSSVLDSAGPPASPSPCPRSRWRLRRLLGASGDMIAISLAVLLLGRLGHAFDGFPKGYDAWGHVSKVKLLLANFPHVNWNYAWYGGLPYFHGSYPPLYHLLVAVGARATGVGVPQVMVTVAAAAMLLICLGLYGFVRVIARQRAAALAAVVFLLGSPAVWGSVLEEGVYPRLLAMAFLSLAMFAAALDARQPSGARCLAVVTALTAALSTHPFMGLLAVVLVGLVQCAASDRPWRFRLLRSAAPIAAAAGLSSYFYLPFLLTPRAQPTLSTRDVPVPWSMVFPTTARLGSLSLILLPVCAVAAVLAIGGLRRPRSPLRAGIASGLRGTVTRPFHMREQAPTSETAIVSVLAASYGPTSETALRLRSWRVRREAMRVPVRVAVALGAVGAGALIYCVAGHAGPFPFYINGMPTADVLVVPSFLLAASAAIVLGGLFGTMRRRWHGAAAAATTIAVGLLGVAVTATLIPRASHDYDSAGTRRLMDMLAVPSDERQFRVAATSDEISAWINSRLGVPQTRGYQVQGVQYPDWQYWLEQSLRAPGTLPAERQFVLDWNAVKWLYADERGAAPAMYLRDSRYELFSPDRYYYQTFQVREPSPILSARATPAAIVIGKDHDYDTLLRALAPSGADSRQFIPVRGGRFVDELDASQLRHFDIVVLYGASAHDAVKARRLLKGYVEGGGGLIVEAAGTEPGLASGGADPIPVQSLGQTDVAGDWGLQWAPHPLLAGLDVSSLASSWRSASSWHLVKAPRLNAWASPVLTGREGESLLAAGQYGRGRVVWSGLNLAFHAAATHSAPESALLASAMRWAGQSSGDPPAASSRFVNAERREVDTGPPATGVLLQENWDPGWHATVNGRPARVFRAGPDHMYVPLTRGSAGPMHVVIRYQTQPLEVAGLGISVVAALALVTVPFWRPLLVRWWES